MGQVVTEYLFDTNILIYWCADVIPDDQIPFVKEQLSKSFNISIISRIEFLSFNKFNNESSEPEQKFIEFAKVFPLDEEIANRAIQLRRSHPIKLPDAVIAATALTHDFGLITRNEPDFYHIPDLQIVNPFSSAS
ncbi:MAG: type II toxin-antitoxin system VapC family toxin [Bacteroidota bacterium]